MRAIAGQSSRSFCGRVSDWAAGTGGGVTAILRDYRHEHTSKYGSPLTSADEARRIRGMIESVCGYNVLCNTAFGPVSLGRMFSGRAGS
jgi:hypothetical protein